MQGVLERSTGKSWPGTWKGPLRRFRPVILGERTAGKRADRSLRGGCRHDAELVYHPLSVHPGADIRDEPGDRRYISEAKQELASIYHSARRGGFEEPPRTV